MDFKALSLYANTKNDVGTKKLVQEQLEHAEALHKEAKQLQINYENRLTDWQQEKATMQSEWQQAMEQWKSEERFHFEKQLSEEKSKFFPMKCSESQ